MLPGTGELVEQLMQREGPGAHSGPGKGKDDKHKPPVVFWDWETKKAEQRSPATTRPPESHEHQDVVPPICNRTPWISPRVQWWQETKEPTFSPAWGW